MRIFFNILIVICMFISTTGEIWAQHDYYPLLDKLNKKPGLTFLKIPAYQQTTDYTCGPATLLTLANHFYSDSYPKTTEVEMQIAREVGTRDLKHEFPGTNPGEMQQWLEGHGFNAELTFEETGDGTALFNLKEFIEGGTPVIVEWSDWGGHWAIAVGYDTRNTEDSMDDVIIFADPYDRHDDTADGYSFFNAVRFYGMWYDALFFGELTWRTMIVATPEER